MTEEQPPPSPSSKGDENRSEISSDAPVSKKTKSTNGVQFPVDQIRKKLKQGQYSDKVGSGSAVYMAAVLEYLTGKKLCAKLWTKILWFFLPDSAEFLEVAGNQTSGAGPNKRIVPHHLRLAAQQDQEVSNYYLRFLSAPASLPNAFS
jgi:histone H2A